VLKLKGSEGIRACGYDPGVKDARLLASPTQSAGPSLEAPDIRQAWLYAALLGTVPTLVVFCILGASNGWHKPWLAFAIAYPALMLLVQGLVQSHDVHRRRKIAREMPTTA
jgi:hypothetical protein